MPSLEQRIRSLLDQARFERRTGREKMAALEVEQSVLRQRNDELGIQIKLLKGLVASDDAEQADSSPAADVPAPWVADELKSLSTVQVIEMTLASHRKAMRVIDIVRKAIAWGFDGPDADEERIFAVFSSALSRGAEGPNPKFVKISRGVFDLAERSSQGRPRPVIEVDADSAN